MAIKGKEEKPSGKYPQVRSSQKKCESISEFKYIKVLNGLVTPNIMRLSFLSIQGPLNRLDLRDQSPLLIIPSGRENQDF